MENSKFQKGSNIGLSLFQSTRIVEHSNWPNSCDVISTKMNKIAAELKEVKIRAGVGLTAGVEFVAAKKGCLVKRLSLKVK